MPEQFTQIGGPGEGKSPMDVGPGVIDIPGAPTAPNKPLEITLPGQPAQPMQPAGPTAPPDEQSFEVKVDGQTVNVTLDELRNGYSRQQDYTRKTQDLAREKEALGPYQELSDYLNANPNLANQIYQTIQQQAPQYGVPGQPAEANPYVQQTSNLERQVAETQLQIEAMQFKQTFPDANLDNVMQYAVDRQIPYLEDAYKSMMYDQFKTDGVAKFAEAAQQGQTAQVETQGAAQPPTSQTIDISGMDDRQKWVLGAKHYGPLEI